MEIYHKTIKTYVLTPRTLSCFSGVKNVLINQYLSVLLLWHWRICPDNKVHGANMGPTWVLSAPDGPILAPWILLSGWASKSRGSFKTDDSRKPCPSMCKLKLNRCGPVYVWWRSRSGPLWHICRDAFTVFSPSFHYIKVTSYDTSWCLKSLAARLFV